MPVQDLGDTDGWVAEPVNHDPFAAPPAPQGGGLGELSSVSKDDFDRAFTGHVAATPDASHPLTAKYLASHPMGSLESYDPSWGERIHQTVSEAGQALGQPVEGAERMGAAVRAGAEIAPGTGNILQVNEAYRAGAAGDPWSAALHTAMAVPIPGVSAEAGAVRRLTPLGFYSHGADVAANLPQRVGTTEQLLANLGKRGVKPVEMEASGVGKLRDAQPQLFQTRAEDLENMFHENLPPLQEQVFSNRTGDEAQERAEQLANDDGYDWDDLDAGQQIHFMREAEGEGTHYGEYTLPRGENYREVLLHTPGPRNNEEADRIGPPFVSSHWNVPNVVAHLRMNDRTGDDADFSDITKRVRGLVGGSWANVKAGAPAAVQAGVITPEEAASWSRLHGITNEFSDRPGAEKSLLHLEELQSDWGQQGREKGFAKQTPQFGWRNRISGNQSPAFASEAERQADYDRLARFMPPDQLANLQPINWTKHETGIPSGPYVTSTQAWTDLGLKRALIEAARGDYTHLSWTPGIEQAKRYNISSVADRIHYDPLGRRLLAFKNNTPVFDKWDVFKDDLPEYIGNELSDKLLSTKPMGYLFSGDGRFIGDPTKSKADGLVKSLHTVAGDDLMVGGQGMKKYYDEIVPNQLTKIVKKLDPNAKIGTTRINGRLQVPSLEITPLLRQEILKGLPQYKRGGRVGMQGGGGLDEDPLAGVATDATQEIDDGPTVGGDGPGQGGGGRGGQTSPATSSESQPGDHPGGAGGVGVRPGPVGGEDFTPAHPDVFHQAISEAKAASSHGAAVALYAPEEYAKMRTFLSPDGKSGFALKGDDIVSVFRHPEGQKGAAQRAIKMAVGLGGQRLNTFDTVLPTLYAKGGFRPVSRLAFDDQYAPEGWDYEKYKEYNNGRPDVVHMVHDPANASHLGGKPVADHDEAIRLQDEALKEIGDGQGTSPAQGSPQLGRPGDGGREAGFRPAQGEAPAPIDLAGEEANAARAAGPYKPVAGLPQKAIPFSDGSHYIPGPLEKAHKAAEAYMRESGLSYDPPRDYAKIDKGFGKRVAQAFEDMAHAPEDPVVKSAYEALARETMAQWKHVKDTGLKVDWIRPGMEDPYASNPRMAIKDIRDNNHWWGYPTDLGYGSTGEDLKAAAVNPMLADSGEEVGGHRARINDIFRIVHDYFGHAKEGHGFRAEGEDNAFRAHAAMYSEKARPAMTSELRGQNSWLNFGPHGEANRTAKAADTIFADQKIGVMPEWTWREKGGGVLGMPSLPGPMPIMAPHAVGRPPVGLMEGEQHLLREQEGLEPPGMYHRPVEWTGGRIAMADGGMLEPVEGDPFGLPEPDRRVRSTDLARAMGMREPRSPMHERLAAASMDDEPLDPSIKAHGGYRPPLTAADIIAGRGGRKEEARGYQDPTFAGQLGETFEHGAERLGAPMSIVRKAGEVGQTVGGLSGVDAPYHAQQAVLAAKHGDYGYAAGEALGAVPVLPGAGAATKAATIKRVDGVLRYADKSFPEGRISTSAPWAAGTDPHAAGGNDVSMALTRGDDPLAGGLPAYLKSAYHKNANIIRGVDDAGKPTTQTIPYLRLPERPRGKMTPEQHLAHDDATHEALINHMESNIEAVHNAVPEETRLGSAQWYEGGHEITKQTALAHDVPHENAAGVFAALSPQKDWDMNVNLGRRVAHILKTTPADARATPEMAKWMRRYAATKPTERVNANTVIKQDVLNDLKAISAKPWSQMDAADKAVYIRAYDEAHGPPDHLMVHDDRTGAPLPKGFHINNPDGSDSAKVARFGPEFPNMVDQPAKVTWGSNHDIARAVKAYQAKNIAQISEAMGEGHKVRSFYNNLIAPHSEAHDLTSDTHAVAAGLLRALGASTDEVQLGLGQRGSATAATGTQGHYANVREAYKRVADRLGVLPREVQSIVWEAVRGLWSSSEKHAGAIKDAVDAHWGRYAKGEMTQADVQRALLGEGGQNINPPRWHGSWKP